MRLRRIAAACVLSLAVAGCSGDDGVSTNSKDETAQASAEPSPSEEPTAVSTSSTGVFEPSEPGPYAVGRRTEQVVDSTRDDRALAVEVWYPADAESAGALAPSPYELIPGLSFDSRLSVGAADVAADGPFPLVVFSHGSGGLRQQSASIVETVASHGFVVIAPDHAGNTAINQLLGNSTPPPVTALNRTQDVTFLLDRVDAGELAAGLTDTESVAVIGHSFGGFTALAAAGGYEGERADERVDAIVPLAPFSEFLTDAALEAIDVPTLIITGDADRVTPVENQSTRPVDLIGDDAELILIEDGTHSVVTDICTIADAVEASDADVPPGTADAVRGQVGDTCDKPDLIERAFDVTEHYSVSFLREHLAGDDRYAEPGPIEGARVG